MISGAEPKKRGEENKEQSETVKKKKKNLTKNNKGAGTSAPRGASLDESTPRRPTS